MLWKRAAAGAPSAAGADEELQPEDGSNSWGSYITGILVVSLAAWTVLYALAIYMQEVKSFKRANVFKVVIFGYMWMVGSIVASLPCIPLLLMGQFSRCRDLAHKTSDMLANTMYSLVFPAPEVRGYEKLPNNDTPCVYVVNHQSTADIALVYRLHRKFAWVSKASVFTIPGVGLIMHLAGYVSIERGSKDSSRKMFSDCKERLRQGWSITIFPQGTRRRHKILDFKHGAFSLAMDAEVPIVPVTLDLPENLWFGARAPSIITVHDPILPGDPLYKDKDLLRKHCFDVVIGGLSYGPAMLQAQQAAGGDANTTSEAKLQRGEDGKKD